MRTAMGRTVQPPSPWAMARVVSVEGLAPGAVLSLDVVWNAVDIAMAVMTLTNLVALIRLHRWGAGALRDYEDQLRAGAAEPVFRGRDNPRLPGDVPGGVWSSSDDADVTAAAADDGSAPVPPAASPAPATTEE